MANVTITLANIQTHVQGGIDKFSCIFTAHPAHWPSSSTMWVSPSGNIHTPPEADDIKLQLTSSSSVPNPTFKDIRIYPVPPTIGAPFTLPNLSSSSGELTLIEQPEIFGGIWIYVLTITVDGTDYTHDPRIYNNGSGVVDHDIDALLNDSQKVLQHAEGHTANL